MAGAIKAGAADEVRRAELEREAAALEELLAERDARLARLADEVADLEAARASEAAPPPLPAPSLAPTFTGVEVGQPPPDPAAAAWAETDTALSALALYAAQPGGAEKGSRGYWRRQLDVLGAHVLPDGGPDDRLRAALRDPRGHAFLEALQECP